MGKQIDPQAKQIIISVIQFCEKEKKNGLLAPHHQAIKRACLATGLSEYTILKIRDEAHITENVDGCKQEKMLSDVCEESGQSTEALPSQGNANEGGSELTPTPMETVLVKIEPKDEVLEDQSQPDEPVSNTGGNELCQYVTIKCEPADACHGDSKPLTVKCEFESTDDPLLAVSHSERVKHEKPSERGGDSAQTSELKKECDKENASTKIPKAPKTYECHICHKKLSAAGKLRTHITLHSDEKPFACNICESKYPHKEGLQRHLKTHTSKQYQCEICHKSFAENSKLMRHLKSHTGEKPYSCHFCQRRFMRNEGLQLHLRIHTGEKPYECNVCQATFTQRATLQKHLRSHSGEKTHKCSVCHSWFACSWTLRVHERSHAGEKPYRCDECGRRFTQSIHLRRHLRTHYNGTKHFQCDICHRRYSEKHWLRVHIKMHFEQKM